MNQQDGDGMPGAISFEVEAMQTLVYRIPSHFETRNRDHIEHPVSSLFCSWTTSVMTLVPPATELSLYV